MGSGLAGMLLSVLSAIASTPAAMEILYHESSKKEKVKELAKCYTPTVLSFIGASICVVSSAGIQARKVSALTAAYTVSESTMQLYQKKVIESIGETKEAKIHDEMAKERLKLNPPPKDVIIQKIGNTICMDSITGRYFESNVDLIKKSFKFLNSRLFEDGTLSINDLFDELGLPTIKYGDMIGWDSQDFKNESFDCYFSTQLTENNQPCVIFEVYKTPKVIS